MTNTRKRIAIGLAASSIMAGAIWLGGYNFPLERSINTLFVIWCIVGTGVIASTYPGIE